METVELVLLLAAAVLVSSVIDQVVPKVSLPLIQIALGVLIAVLSSSSIDVTLSPELFLVVFIAPLLFHDAKESDKLGLWKGRREILWLAIGLVVAICLVVGYSLHWLVPSVPLAAAFALGAALGPTDAVAVSSLSGSAELDRKEHALLSGESLLNDATGVVSFQFAVAAAVTGAFSLVDATVSFTLSFIGGIGLGILLAFVARFIQERVRVLGLESITFHVLFEVFLPFLIYLFAEVCHVSGILAVVACGLTLSGLSERVISPQASRQSIVSSSVWRVLAFTLNGIVFILLGMQLPRAMQSTWDDVVIDNFTLIGYVLAITALIVVVRFIWVLFGQRIFHDRGCTERVPLGRAALRSALIATVGGPKGAVTLSVIFSLPFFLDDGSAFPQRNLLIFLASGVILCTLIIANFVLPLLAPRTEEVEESPEAYARVRVEILRRVIEGLVASQTEENMRANRAVIKAYNDRIEAIRTEADIESASMTKLRLEVIAAQEDHLAKLIEEGEVDELDGYDVLRQLEQSRGYLLHRGGGHRMAGWLMTHVDTVVKIAHKYLRYLRSKLHGRAPSNSKADIYHMLDLYAVKWLHDINTSEESVSVYPPEAVAILIISFQAAANALDATRPDITLYAHTTDGMNEIERSAYYLELEEIQHRLEDGELTRAQAKKLRDNVYLMLVDLDAYM